MPEWLPVIGGSGPPASSQATDLLQLFCARLCTVTVPDQVMVTRLTDCVHAGKLTSPNRYPTAEEAEDESPSKLRGMQALAFPTLMVQEDVLEPAAAAIKVRPLTSAQLYDDASVRL